MNTPGPALSLSEIREFHLTRPAGMPDIRNVLLCKGYSGRNAEDLLALWERDRDAIESESEAYLQVCKLRQRASELVWCNPVYLILDAIKTNLQGLEECMHAQLSKMNPYPLHFPDIITPTALTDIVQRLRPLVEADLPHYQAVLGNLYTSLKHAEAVLHKLCPEQADTEDDDDLYPPAGTWGSPPDDDDD